MLPLQTDFLRRNKTILFNQVNSGQPPQNTSLDVREKAESIQLRKELQDNTVQYDNQPDVSIYYRNSQLFNKVSMTTECIKSWNVYYPHNNIEVIINKIRKKKIKSFKRVGLLSLLSPKLSQITSTPKLTPVKTISQKNLKAVYPTSFSKFNLD